jgi:hypothetical protein
MAAGTHARLCKDRFRHAQWVAVATVLACSLLVGVNTAAANHIAYSQGDVFAGVGAGKINHYSPTGTLLEVLNTTSGPTNPPGSETGMCFDPSGNLYTTNYDALDMAKFNNLGGLTTYPFGPDFLFPPETCAVDPAGRSLYVGTAELNNELFKLDTNGNVLNDFFLVRDQGGINWIDINPTNQCEIYYTSEGTLVKRFNVCTNTQLSDFASGLPFGASGCFALRIRSNGEVMVACDAQIVRLNTSGAIVQSYNPGSEADFFALSLDPDGVSFWAAGYVSGHIYKVNIASGATSTNWIAPLGSGAGLAGLAVYGDGAADPGYPTPRGATPTRVSLTPSYNQCTSPNRLHGPPDIPGGTNPDGSCNPPVQTSSQLTVGTIDANGAAANSIGSVRYAVVVGDPATVVSEADVRIATSITDVRRSTPGFPDYTGELEVVSTLQVTDKFNSAEPATQPFNDTGTGATSLAVKVPCAATGSTSIGGNCSLTTTANAIHPGFVQETKRAMWQLGQVEVFDGGPDGLVSTTPNTVFMKQGIFVP